MPTKREAEEALVERANSTAIRDSLILFLFLPRTCFSTTLFLQFDVTLMALNVVFGRDIPGDQLVSHSFSISHK